MFELFTDRARQVMLLANQSATSLNHEYVGTEHILLGLIREGSGIAAHVLKNLDIDLHKATTEVERVVQAGPDRVIMGKLPKTPRAMKVIEYAAEEAKSLGHNYIGTEHLLLGVLREQEGIAAQVLLNLGTSLEAVREEILNLLDFTKIDIPESSPAEHMRVKLEEIKRIVNIATDPMVALEEIRKLLRG